MGFPLCGDVKYGASAPLADKSIALHAWKLSLSHPTLRSEIEFTCTPPVADILSGIRRPDHDYDNAGFSHPWEGW